VTCASSSEKKLGVNSEACSTRHTSWSIVRASSRLRTGARLRCRLFGNGVKIAFTYDVKGTTNIRTVWTPGSTEPHHFHQNLNKNSLPKNIPRWATLITIVLTFGNEKGPYSSTIVLPNGTNRNRYQKITNLEENRIIVYCPPSEGRISIFPADAYHAIGFVQTGRFTIVASMALFGKNPISWSTIEEGFSAPTDIVTRVDCMHAKAGNIARTYRNNASNRVNK